MMQRTMKLQLAILRAVALTFFALATFVSANANGAPAKHTFAIGTNDFLLDGQYFQIRCGEIHAARVPRNTGATVCKWPGRWD
jgi:hypothetical protein